MSIAVPLLLTPEYKPEVRLSVPTHHIAISTA